MAHYKVKYNVEGKNFYAEGESSYPSDEAIVENDIASAHKKSMHLEEKIEHKSISFEIYK